MLAFEAKLTYQMKKGKEDEENIIVTQYKRQRYSSFTETENKPLTPLSKVPDELVVEFFIMTYKGPVLDTNGELKEEDFTDVRENVKTINSLMSDCAEFHRPPICKVKWGEEIFRGMLVDLKYRYTLFHKDGTPVKAIFNAVFREIVDVDAAMQNDNTPQSPDRSKYRLVYEQTRLYQLAYQEYDDPSCWRVIAEANGISNPLNLEVGAMLSLPPLQ